MSKHSRPSIRHCPVCGIAMQAGRSREDAVHYDIFQCLSCEAMIRESKPAARDKDR